MVGHSISESVRRTPFSKLFLLFSSGILLAAHIALPSWLLYVFSMLTIIVLAVMVFLTFLSRSVPHMLFATLIYTSFLLFGFLSLAYRLPDHQAATMENSAADLFIGYIADEPTIREKTVRFPLRITNGQLGSNRFTISSSVMVSVARTAETIAFTYGDEIAIANKLQLISAPHNPNQFDYQRYCANKNIYHQAFLQEGACKLLKHNKGNPIVGMALRMRHQLKAKFQKVLFDSESLSVCAALIFGHRSDFNADVLQTFSETGTIHVLSVSGMHVGIVFFLLNFVLSPFKRYKYGASIRFVFILTAIWSYVILTGMAPSILRAGLMISFVLVADLAKRSYGSLNSLFASAFFLVLFDPFLLFDVGFQLSYAAVFGLFTLYPLLRSMFYVKYALLRALVELTWVSISAQLFTTPLALYYFHQFPTYFLAGNLFIAIPSTLLMYVGILLAISPFAALNTMLGQCLVLLCRAMLKGLHIIQSLPLSVVSGIHLTGVDLFLSMALLFICLWTWYSRLKAALFALLLCALLLSVSSMVQRIQLQQFQGIKMYNVQREVAIAVIDAGQVALISTLDSFDHPRIRNLVWPDLSIYGNRNKTTFHKLEMQRGETQLIKTAFGDIALVDQFYDVATLASASWIVLRHVQATDSIEFRTIYPDRAVIFDGSNATEAILSMVEATPFAHLHYYILKDNFAYVWEKPD